MNNNTALVLANDTVRNYDDIYGGNTGGGANTRNVPAQYVKLIGGRSLSVNCNDPIFESYEAFELFLKNNNLMTDKKEEIQWLYILISALIGLGLGWFIFGNKSKKTNK